MQRAKLLNQHFSGNQFQLEIKRTLHEDMDGFLLRHGLLLHDGQILSRNVYAASTHTRQRPDFFAW